MNGPYFRFSFLKISMSVLIGLADHAVGALEQPHWDANKIGGKPSWLHTSSPQEDNPRCSLCGHVTSLITQLYCPLGGSAYHRCIHIFACLSQCSRHHQGWTVLRSLQFDTTYTSASPGISKSQDSIQQDSWLDDQNNWGDEADDWGDAADDWGDAADEQDVSVSDCGLVSKDCGPVSSNNSNMQEKPTVCHQEDICDETAFAMEVKDDDHAGCTVELSKLRIVTSTDDSDLAESNVRLTTPLCSEDDTNLRTSTAGSFPPPPSTDRLEEVGGKIMEGAEDMLLADAERWSAMTNLLNMKYAKAESLEISDPDRTTVLRSYYLSVIEEPFAAVPDSDPHIAELLENYEKSEGKQMAALMSESSRSKRSGGSECYEKAELKHGDKVFHKFVQRIQRCPQQCVRYDRGGCPLLVSHLEGQGQDLVSVEKCQYCGGSRVFELQLMPPLLHWVRTEKGCLTPLEFGTVLVYTCSKNCWPQHPHSDLGGPHDPRNELVLLQADPDQHLYR